MSRPVVILIGHCPPDGFDELLCPIVESVVRKYLHKPSQFLKAFRDAEILDLAANNEIDLFLLILNNICFPEKSGATWMEYVADLIRYLKAVYNKPIIGLTTLAKEFRAKTNGISLDYLIPLPLKAEELEAAIREFVRLESRRVPYDKQE